MFLVIYQKRIVTQENRLQKLENERQQFLLKATIEGQERERERLAKDLHDGIGSLLSALNLNLKFQKSRENLDKEQKFFLVEACEMVEEGIKNVRSVSHNLMPSTLENFGLITAMKECISPINKLGTINTQIKLINTPFQLPKTLALGLLRVFQELVQNTLKHANASQITASLEFHVNCIYFTYTDSGEGFNFTSSNSNGIGIKNIESRIQALDGTFFINHNTNKGYLIEIEVPIVTKSKKA
ncbi:MAG: hypothetical protein JKY02_03950 [Flavobacteriaceae bacterium]|nr:hypothetical protein [Flavobacteriaceae bacterium]